MNAGTLVLAIIILTLMFVVMPKRIAGAMLILVCAIGWVVILLLIYGAMRGFR